MSLKTVTVTGTLLNPNGQSVAGARIRAELTRQEVDNGIVVPTAVETVTAADGSFSLALWPNARGVAGSQYRVRSMHAYTQLLNVLITVPDTELPVALTAIIDQPPYPPVSDAQQAQQAAQQAAVDAQAARQGAELAQQGAESAATSIEYSAWEIGENRRRVLRDRYGDGPYPAAEFDFRGGDM